MLLGVLARGLAARKRNAARLRDNTVKLSSTNVRFVVCLALFARYIYQDGH